MFDEPKHPRFGEYVHQHTKDWSATISRGDAFVFVIPEYNYGFNAAIKNAIDYLNTEWQYKPVGFVSYGGVAAGTRAMQMLKQVITTLKMVPDGRGGQHPVRAAVPRRGPQAAAERDHGDRRDRDARRTRPVDRIAAHSAGAFGAGHGLGPGMHSVDPTTEQMIRSVLAYAETRLRLDPVPLDGVPRDPAELGAALHGMLNASGNDPDHVLGVYAATLAPAVISADSPRFLGFIPAAPTKAALLFDMLISCASIQGISWLEAAGAIQAENQVLRLIADRAGLPG